MTLLTKSLASFRVNRVANICTNSAAHPVSGAPADMKTNPDPETVAPFLGGFRFRRVGAIIVLLASVLPAIPSLPAAHAQTATLSSLAAASTSRIPVAETQEQNSQEDSGRGDREVFRQSVAVRSVGRRFHLAAEPAARIFELFNFALLLAGVLYLFLKFFPRYLRTHRDQISRQILDARTASEQATAQLKAVEDKLQGLDAEIRSIREQADREAAAEEVRVHALIEAARQRILASADREIAAAVAEARREIKRFAGDIAIERARGMVSLSPNADRALTEEIANRLARRAAAGDFVPPAGAAGRNGDRN